MLELNSEKLIEHFGQCLEMAEKAYRSRNESKSAGTNSWHPAEWDRTNMTNMAIAIFNATCIVEYGESPQAQSSDNLRDGMFLSRDEADLVRQWYQSLEDVNHKFLEERDVVLHRKVMRHLGLIFRERHVRVLGEDVLETRTITQAEAEKLNKGERSEDNQGTWMLLSLFEKRKLYILTDGLDSFDQGLFTEDELSSEEQKMSQTGSRNALFWVLKSEFDSVKEVRDGKTDT